jgi:DNA-binding GntR family transcriptional regulator
MPERARGGYMSILLKSDSKYSKKELAYQAIKQEIISNKLKPGTKLVERQLCESLNISRTPIREALQQLVADGLASTVTGEGVVVSEITYEDVRETFDVREVLEGLAAREFALYAGNEAVEKLMQLLTRFEEGSEQEGDAFVQYNRIFHQMIIDGTHNIKLRLMMNSINDQIDRITYLVGQDQEQAKAAHLQHRNLLNFLKQKDPQKAEIVMREHISDNKEYHLHNIHRLRNINWIKQQ